jgi:NADPH:quinone reductase-like Zn-dependent oxidoreductase
MAVDEIIFYTREDVAARVRELTGGEGVPVVYDTVGKDTFEASLASLPPSRPCWSAAARPPAGPADRSR